MNVLITGPEGFVGKNLRVSLQQREDIHLLRFDVQDEPAALQGLLEQADFVFHLAGVNRPQSPEEFQTGNAGLTEQICRYLADGNRRVPVLVTSSIQAAQDNPYGISKRVAEDAVFAYGRQNGAPVYVYRLPNVFGKWVGRNNSIFKMPKFRTMRTDTPAVATHLLGDPDRWLTPIGKFLRKSSIDELPQLWCILSGDMSFVGAASCTVQPG